MDNLLEFVINPFGQVSHSAVNTADYGTGGPGLLVHFGSAVELWYPAWLLKASLEVGLVFFWELLLVGLYQQPELVCCSIKTTFSRLFGKKPVCLWIKEMVLQASLFVH